MTFEGFISRRRREMADRYDQAVEGIDQSNNSRVCPDNDVADVVDDAADDVDAAADDVDADGDADADDA